MPTDPRDDEKRRREEAQLHRGEVTTALGTAVRFPNLRNVVALRAFHEWYDALDKRGRYINTSALREGFVAGWIEHGAAWAGENTPL